MPERRLGPGRLEAFSDGVIAIIITIMVLDLKSPADHRPEALWALWPTFVAYALSYFLVAVYWLNHHHLFSFVHRVDTAILWANMLVLFCISLIPFSTAYIGNQGLAPFPSALYAATMLVCGAAFMVLRWAVSRQFRDDIEIGDYRRLAGRKNIIALVLYAIALPAAYLHPAITLVLTLLVSLLYLDPRAFVERNPFKLPEP